MTSYHNRRQDRVKPVGQRPDEFVNLDSSQRLTHRLLRDLGAVGRATTAGGVEHPEQVVNSHRPF